MSLEQIKAFFHEADKDGSGTLSYQELSSALRSRGYTCTERELKVNHHWLYHWFTYMYANLTNIHFSL